MSKSSKAEERRLRKIQIKNEKKRALRDKRIKQITIGSVIVAVIVLTNVYTYWESQQPGMYDEFAQCLTEKGFIMVGTNTCNYCNKQKDRLGKSFQYINYKNCNQDPGWCASSGIDDFPTWVLPDGSIKSGLQELQTLSDLSGCEL